MSTQTGDSPDGVPFGYCYCGCGERTRLAIYNCTEKGHVFGMPLCYVNHHNAKGYRGPQRVEVVGGIAYRFIPLGKGKEAVINEDCFHLIKHLHNWCARKDRNTWYATCRVNGKDVHMHNLICPPPPGHTTDHRDGNGLNNRSDNLRPATGSQNQRNRHHLNVNKTSKFRGVCWNKVMHGWQVDATLNRKSVYLGCFAEELTAALVWDDFVIEHYGEFAKPNFIKNPSSQGARLDGATGRFMASPALI